MEKNADWTKMPKKSTDKFVDENLVGNTGVKSNRKTGKQASGTSQLQSAQMGSASSKTKLGN